jgi:hypothetical protein
MSVDNVILSGVCGAGVALAVVVAWRGRSLPIVAERRDGSSEPGSSKRRAGEAVQTLACALTAALGAGLLVLGLGGRLVMRVAAATSTSTVQGMTTEAGETVGEITFSGTLGFLIFVGLLGGLLGAAAYLPLRWALPRTAGPAGLVIGALLLGTVGVADALDPDNVDFLIVTPLWLTVTMVVATGLLYGATFTALVARLARSVPIAGEPAGEGSKAAAGAYASLVVLIVPMVLVAAAVYVLARTFAAPLLDPLLARRSVLAVGRTLVLVAAIAAAVVVGSAGAEILG